MSESSVQVLKRVAAASDVDIVDFVMESFKRVFEDTHPDVATAAMIVSTLVGWFYMTLESGSERSDFEQCIEAQYILALEYPKE